jgi:hypothetical protein
MSQEYELLPKEIKEQFELHVSTHEQYKQQAALMGFLDMIPSDGSQGLPEDPTQQDMSVEVAGPPDMGAGAQMSANGAVPDVTA